jgi:hypothetical protein
MSEPLQSWVGPSEPIGKLKFLALAMHNYHAVNGTLPPAAVTAPDGTPLLSWRVLLLPYLGQFNLSKQFDLSEPWDGPHNGKLLSPMPTAFDPAGRTAGTDITTYYQVFTGKRTAFEGTKGLDFKHGFPDGTSTTILVVEAAKPVPWAAPLDVRYDPDKPLPELGGVRPGEFLVAMVDGSVRYVSRKVSEKTLRAAITRNDCGLLGDDC